MSKNFGTDEHLIELLQAVLDDIDTPMGRIAHAKTFNTITEVIAVLKKRLPSATHDDVIGIAKIDAPRPNQIADQASVSHYTMGQIQVAAMKSFNDYMESQLRSGDKQ